LIIVASVSCIFGIGSVETYGGDLTQESRPGKSYDQREVISIWVAQQLQRNDQGFQRGCFRVRGGPVFGSCGPCHQEIARCGSPFLQRSWKASLIWTPLTARRRARATGCGSMRNSHYVNAASDDPAGDHLNQGELRCGWTNLVAEGKNCGSPAP